MTPPANRMLRPRAQEKLWHPQETCNDLRQEMTTAVQKQTGTFASPVAAL